jgi:hypothetical protein
MQTMKLFRVCDCARGGERDMQSRQTMGRTSKNTTIIYDEYPYAMPMGGFDYPVASDSYSFVQDLRRAKLESLRLQQEQELERREMQMIEQAQKQVSEWLTLAWLNSFSA